ncbi:MAG: 2-C-methyl-D-erythritol 2,4-cyclodiphosphate synthase [Candidatus Methylomirabilales bacterium]
MRVGIGYDLHPLVSGRRLVLGGVGIPFARGLDGHSDADVLTHAIIDALCGAAGMGDIGRRFGTDDPATKGIASLLLLERAWREIQTGGYRVSNVDATILAEAPRLQPYVGEMAKRLANVLGIGVHRVNIKATTAKGQGEIGAGQAIACFAAVLLEEG